MNTPSRHNWLLLLQGWSILWIVLGNTYLEQPGNEPEWVNILLRTAYSFHLPLLMFVSGCVFCKMFLLQEDREKTGGSLKEHIFGLLIPYLLFSIVAIFIKVLLSMEPYSLRLLVSDLIRGFFFPGLQPISAMWFMLVLVCYYLMLPIWKLTFENNWYICLVATLLLVVHLFTLPVELLAIKWICFFAVYFYLGIIVMKKGWLDYLSGMTGFWVFLIGNVVYFTGLDIDKTIAEIGGITYSVGLVLILNNSFPKTFFSFRDYYLQIFLMGYFVQVLFRMFYVHISMPYILGYMICLVLGIYIPVIIANFIHSNKLTSLYSVIGLNLNTNKLTTI